MAETDARRSIVFIIGPTESVLTTRGNRHPSLASYLVKNGKSVVYISSNFSHAEKRYFSREEVCAGEARAPYKLVIFRSLGYRRNVSIRRVIHNFLFSVRTFLWLLFRATSKDTVVLPSRPVELIFFIGLLHKLRRCDVVLDIQDTWPDALDISDGRKEWVFEKYCNFYLRPSLKWISKFVHVAPSFTHWLNRYSPEASSVFIPLGYDAPRFEGISWSNARDMHNPVELVCVGMLQHQIDVMPILEALVERPSVKFTIIGEDGSGDRYAEVTEFIDQQALGNVSLVGRIPPDDMPAHLAEMDIGIVPMITNSIPNKVFDYIAAYLPILVLGHNDSGEFVTSAEIGWQVPYTSDGVARFLDSLDRQDYRRKLAKLGECRESYDRQKLFSAVLRMIEA